ncbi:MAG: hypothetical protein ACYTGC_05180 [Planctomycetota bacterium]|jgi:hypothetical protein
MRRRSWIWSAVVVTGLAGLAGPHWAESGGQSTEQTVARPVEASPVAGAPREIEVAPTATPFVVRARDVEFFKTLLDARRTRIKPLAKEMLIDPTTEPERTPRGADAAGRGAASSEGGGVRRTVRIESGESVNSSPNFRFRALSRGTSGDEPGARPRTIEQRRAAVEAYRRSLTKRRDRSSD